MSWSCYSIVKGRQLPAFTAAAQLVNWRGDVPWPQTRVPPQPGQGPLFSLTLQLALGSVSCKLEVPREGQALLPARPGYLKGFSPATSWKAKPPPPACVSGTSWERALLQDTGQHWP